MEHSRILFIVGLEKVLQPASQLRAAARPLSKPTPDKNALKIYLFKGSHKFRLRSAVKLFPGLVNPSIYVLKGRFTKIILPLNTFTNE